MSAVMTPRRARRRRPRPAAPGGQSALFGAASLPVAAPAEPTAPEAVAVAAAPAAPEVAAPERAASPVAKSAATAPAHRHGPTLDDLVAGVWEGLVAGAGADCLVCGAPLAPRHSAGAGVVGGRCGGCGTTVS
jgi:hypothetical protein